MNRALHDMAMAYIYIVLISDSCSGYLHNYAVFTCIIQVLEVRYIRDRNEQLRIAQACHADKTSGHLGYRKTLA